MLACVSEYLSEYLSVVYGRNGDEWWRVRSRVQTTLMKPMVVSEYVPEMDKISLTFVDRYVVWPLLSSFLIKYLL